jgi:hypothetical protein
MRTTWEKIVHHVGTIYGHDVSNELQNKKTVPVPKPVHTQEVLDKHQDRIIRHNVQEQRFIQARESKKQLLEALIVAGDADAEMELALLQQQIDEAAYLATTDLPIKLSDEERTEHDNNWRTYRERNSRLEKQRGQAFSMIRGQCMQVLLDKMKHDPDWTAASESYNPLIFFRLIEKTILAQTEDQYPYATVYEQELALYGFAQNALSNEQWYERFNTKIDVGSAIGITRQHQVLLEHVAAETGTTKFDALTADEQKVVREKAEERYLSYVFLRQSGKQHNKLKVDLQNDFTTGDDRYPKNRQSTLHLLDKYSKSVIVTSTSTSEGTAFTQKGGRGGSNEPYDKKYWKDKECFKCNKKGHPSSHCNTASGGGESRNSKSTSASKSTKTPKSDDDKSLSSKSDTITKLKKQMKKSFATMAVKIEELEHEDSDITNSDSEADKTSHFQYQDDEEPSTGFLMMQLESRTTQVLFKQNHRNKIGLNLKEIILLDSQSTMDLFCNPNLVEEITKTNKKMKLQSNGGTMTVDQKAKMAGYIHDVWFSTNAITNILALRNVTKQYRVTYDSTDQMFVVHREHQNKPNMEFKMHESGLHYFDPRNEAHVFVNTVSGNKEGFSQRQLKGAELAKSLYAKLGYPSPKDYRWIIQSNQISDCPVTVQDVDNAHTIWGKNIAALKGKNTRTKPIHVAGNFVKVPKELLKLHKDVYMTADILFVNRIPFFITLSRKICFTTVNHLNDRKVSTIFKAFKEIYQLEGSIARSTKKIHRVTVSCHVQRAPSVLGPVAMCKAVSSL